MRPVRHHLGITSFGVTTWTGRIAGDRIINEHREAERGVACCESFTGRKAEALDHLRRAIDCQSAFGTTPGMIPISTRSATSLLSKNLIGR